MFPSSTACQRCSTALPAAPYSPFPVYVVGQKAANIAVAPAVPLVTVLGTAAAALGPVWEGGAVLLAAACAPALWWLETVADIAAGLPGSPPVMPG